MKFSDVERALDVAKSDADRERILKRSLPMLRGGDVRSALICLANVYARLKKFRLAGDVYETVGMNEEAVKVRARLRK